MNVCSIWMDLKKTISNFGLIMFRNFIQNFNFYIFLEDSNDYSYFYF